MPGRKIGDAYIAVHGDSTSFTSTLKGVGGVIAGLVAGAGLAKLGKMGITAAADMQQAQIGFTTMLHSGAAAQAFLKQLQSFAAATPFELPGLIDSARLLLGVGVAAKNVIPTLTAWGNAASAMGISGDRFKSALLAVSQSLGAGKINAQDMNQIINAGIPIWKLMSEATGKTVPQLRKLSEQGKLLSADILPKVQAQMNKDYGGSMVAQSRSLNGVWSTLMDTMRIGMANALAPLVPVLSAAIPKAAEVLSKVLAGASRGMAVFFTMFRAGWSGGAGAGAGAIQQLGNLAHGVFTWLATTGVSLLRQLADMLRQVVNVTADVVRWLNAHRAAVAAVLGVIAALVAIERLHAAVTFVTSGALMAKVTAIGAVRGAMLIAAGVQALATSGLYTWLGVNAIDAAAWVAKSARIVASTVALAAHAVVIGVVRTATLVWTGVQWLLNAALTANPIGLIVVAIGILIAAIVYVAVKTRFFQTVWAAVWGFLKAVGAWFAGPFAGFFVGAYNRVVGAAVAAWHGIVAAWNAVVNAAKTAVSFYLSIPGRILSALGNLGSLLFDAGKNIIQGLINGIKSMIGAVGNAVSGIVNKVKGFLPWSPVKEGPFSGTGSPWHAGRNIVRMLAEGIASQDDQIRVSLSRALAIPAAGGTPSGQTVQGGTGRGLTFAPTYNVRAPVDERQLARETVARLMFSLQTGAVR